MPKLPNRSCQFWGPNRKTRATGFEVKPGEIVDTGFEVKTEKTVATSFETKVEKTVTTSVEAKLEKTVTTGFKAKSEKTVTTGFEAQPKNLRYSSPHARCRPHTVLLDLPIVRPPSTWPVRPSPILCTRSSTPATILIAVRHAAPATCISQDKQTWFFTRYKDKGKTTKMSCIRIQTSPSQWLITLKPRNWPLGLSISPWWVNWQQKAQTLKFESKTLWSTARRPKKLRKAQEGHLEEEKPATPINGMKSGKPKKRAKKSSKLENSTLPPKINSL
jgi:hypothetical protein